MDNTSKKIDGFHMDENDFRKIVKIVKDQAGIVLADHKKDMVYGRLARRLRVLQLETFREYCDLVDSSHEELLNLINAITTNLTSFFREMHHFEKLEELLMDMIGKQTDILIWSSACSSGCEPYSIAMVAQKVLEKKGGGSKIKILATDIDTNMLEICVKGEYPIEHLEKIPKEYHRYIERGADGAVKMSNKLKGLIHFKKLNLLDKWPMTKKYDIIFCRNVVIYFDTDTQRVLFDKMANLLKDAHYIFIGHSENLTKVSDRYDLIGRTTYKKRK
jgi:chemotaxis protein methyltransferase CheR